MTTLYAIDSDLTFLLAGQPGTRFVVRAGGDPRSAAIDTNARSPRTAA